MPGIVDDVNVTPSGCVVTLKSYKSHSRGHLGETMFLSRVEAGATVNESKNQSR